jgi:hypothetical protein
VRHVAFANSSLIDFWMAASVSTSTAAVACQMKNRMKSRKGWSRGVRRVDAKSDERRTKQEDEAREGGRD